MNFNSNIKFLRKRRGRTQDEVAFALDMKRSTLSGYENKVAQPGIDTLVAFSEYFNIAVDTLIKVDLAELSEYHLNQLERGFDVFIKGSNLRVLTTTIDSQNNENIELVNEKPKPATAPVLPIRNILRCSRLFICRFCRAAKKYRTFQISGDSMLPIPDKSYVTGEYVIDWQFLRSHQPILCLRVKMAWFLSL